ncbi:hypothetical protein [Paenibacillus sp. IHB B 3084]|uniref:hypothetical protein n=1 Tax=Paenibacillus sp. IHB B 3084 TaxID=867076 RepID=UPI000A99E54E|nr:hypothetical protein [Paenibacillus sp. IHB B 3084]
MQNETLLRLALIGASLQVVIQLLGLSKALLEWLTARQNAKSSNRCERLKPKKQNLDS